MTLTPTDLIIAVAALFFVMLLFIGIGDWLSERRERRRRERSLRQHLSELDDEWRRL